MIEQLGKENYLIGVPSRGRAFLLKERRGIWKYANVGTPMLRICLRGGDYAKYLPYLNDSSGAKVCCVLNEYNLSMKRQHMLEYAIEVGVEYLFLIDDDVVFYYRDERVSSKYVGAASKFLSANGFNRILYESIMLCNSDYPMVGICNKQGSQSVKYTFSLNRPIVRLMCFHVPTLMRENVRFDQMQVPFMSDRYVQLKLLSLGYRTISNANFCVDDPGTNYRGGCSETRSGELQTNTAITLQSLFPEYVKLKEKSNGMWKENRLDCKIDWAKFSPELKYLPKLEGLKIIESEGYECL